MNKKNETSNSVKHIVSLVLGIISIVFCAFWYITLPTSIKHKAIKETKVN